MSLAQQIAHITDSVNIIDIAHTYKVALDDENRTTCFEGHDTDSATLHFDEQTQIYQCTSPNCRLHGNVFDLVAQQEGCSFEDAVEIVAQMRGIDFTAEGHGAELKQYTLVRNCLREAGRFYARRLDGAMSYLYQRGISRGTAERYLVGRSGSKDELREWLLN